MSQWETMSIRTRLIILGAWTLLVALLVLFQFLRLHYKIAQPRYMDPWLIPTWIPLATFVLVGAGFGLVSARWMLGRTPLGRCWTTLYVGIVSLAAVFALAFDMALHVSLRASPW
ncbi:MAG: hypothetical protein JW889_04905 [Verrucomicrobia bacterium]|nr:hypothetical protein [Verrucomicrobiota bacterium]